MSPLPALLCLSLALPFAAHAAPQSSAHTLLAVGDIAQCPGPITAQTPAVRTAALAARYPEARIALLGDITYPVGAAREYAECFEPTWGKLRARTLPAPGNHDYATAAGAAYYDYFGPLAGPERRGYYSLRLGSWLLVSLNSNLHGEAASAQLDWLRAELAAARGKRQCLLAQWHHPVFSSGLHGNNAEMRPALELLQAAGTDLILTGHDHHYERFAHLGADGTLLSSGPRHFVIGTGGAGLYPVSTRQPGSEAAIAGQHGLLVLQLAEKSYTWSFQGVDTPAAQDAGTDNCLPKPAQ